MNRHANPFSLQEIKSSLLKWLLQRVSKVDVLEKWYEEWLNNQPTSARDDISFIDYTLRCLKIETEITGFDILQQMPEKGPLLVVANHPLGGIEGMILTRALKQKRPDIKVLTNEMLARIPEFKDVFIGVDVLNPGRSQHNMRGMQAVARHLASGGALLVFPAGTVSQIRLPSMKISDAPWNSMISRLARKYGAPVFPVFVEGRNSFSFYLSAYIHKRLRTLMLPRAMVAKSGSTIKIHFGQLIAESDIRRLADDVIAMNYIRLCCEVLGQPTQDIERRHPAAMTKIKDNLCENRVIAHLEKIKSFHILQQGSLSLYCAPYAELGPVMEQLSIEREHAFRAIGEGTGKELDSDRFDPDYTHLFLWDENKRRIAGGYRLAKTDDVAHRKGLRGLYSHSLFSYNAQFLNRMGKTIEVGRSFIAEEYQKNPAALDLLWKGIGRYVAANPEYHTLFGCVSISAEYSRLASAMLTETFLSHYGVEDSISRQVKARVPLRAIQKLWTAEQLMSLREIPIIGKLIGRIDSGKSVPVLIRHYLALNGKFISFTVNNGFNNALDGLIMVDLRNAPSRYLERYMGKDGMTRFISRHKSTGNKEQAVGLEYPEARKTL